MGFFRQEYWSVLSFPSSGDFPDPGTKSASPMSPALQVGSLPAEPTLGEVSVVISFDVSEK